MCVVSMVTDKYMEKWFPPYIPPDSPYIPPNTDNPFKWPRPSMPPVSPEEYEDFLDLIRRAKEYDKRTGQPDCPDPEKVKWRKWLDEYMQEKYPYLKPV